MITALLVDDEPSAIARLCELLALMPDVEVIGTARSVADAERFLTVRTPDVVFLDMTMPGRMGLELLSSVRPPTRVIFVTANESFAIPAFDHGAVDFLLKPFGRERLETAVERLRKQRVPPPAGAPADVQMDADSPTEEGDPSADGKLSLDGKVALASDRGRSVERVPVADIAWVMAMENYSRTQLAARETALVRRRITEWAAILPEPPFHRLDRSLIVNIDRVVRTQRQSRDQTVVFFDGVTTPLPIGRTAMARLQEIMGE